MQEDDHRESERINIICTELKEQFESTNCKIFSLKYLGEYKFHEERGWFDGSCMSCLILVKNLRVLLQDSRGLSEHKF